MMNSKIVGIFYMIWLKYKYVFEINKNLEDYFLRILVFFKKVDKKNLKFFNISRKLKEKR